MGDALDDGAFEAYEPEPEGGLDDDDLDDEAPAGAALGKRKLEDEQEGAVSKKKKKKQRGKKKKKGAAGAEEEEEATTNGGGGGAGPVADDEDEAADEGEEGAPAAGDQKKKKKKRKRKKPSTTEAPSGQERATADGQASYLWARYCELLDVSPLDRDVQRFPPTRFVLPAAAAAAAVAAAATPKQSQAKGTGKGPGKGKEEVPETGLTEFLKRTFPDFQKLASDKANRLPGRPLVVVVSPAAVRANDLAKELRVRLPNQRTAKLFAKHIKIKEQAEALGKEFAAVAVGTPNRLSKLLEAGALSLAGCRLLVLDATFRDAKQFTILTLPGVAKDTALLLRDHVLPALEGAGQGAAEALRIAMF